MFVNIYSFPFFRFLLSEPSQGFMMPPTVIADRLYAMVFPANYSTQEEEFDGNALQTVESSSDDRNLHR